jgi:hypothetical protein
MCGGAAVTDAEHERFGDAVRAAANDHGDLLVQTRGDPLADGKLRAFERLERSLMRAGTAIVAVDGDSDLDRRGRCRPAARCNKSEAGHKNCHSHDRSLPLGVNFIPAWNVTSL